jgi:suppressor for copper-sensitivity B
MVMAVVVLALRRRLPQRARPAAFVAVAALAALTVATPFQAVSTAVTETASKDVPWVAFDRAAIPGLVKAGKLVFVDVTADWCITCQVNKAAVINRGEVADRLTRPNVVYMRADWTKPDDAIAAYLASFGRYGIPFNAVYGPGAADGLALPELLTADEVLAALDLASRPN